MASPLQPDHGRSPAASSSAPVPLRRSRRTEGRRGGSRPASQALRRGLARPLPRRQPRSTLRGHPPHGRCRPRAAGARGPPPPEAAGRSGGAPPSPWQRSGRKPHPGHAAAEPTGAVTEAERREPARLAGEVEAGSAGGHRRRPRPASTAPGLRPRPGRVLPAQGAA
ncbi:protein chibby homolog 1 isoform X1 [Falco rusticolus]|uniref:protein chibby homolog 1 isoform X1 n=1 Tax=Falco rusticolus TaxID=120794 RepID=UPI00188662E0|nr:protein chibby homolog 1 isoform X1 [Falco rusticolus]XP_055567730.1 protein chibby homolog 1 isoform X1 [Falco cherrug]